MRQKQGNRGTIYKAGIAMVNQSYWNRLNLVHDLAEEATGVPFDDFIELCEGNKAFASLYFGWKLWRVLGRAKYDNAYKRKIELLQKKRPLKFESLTKLSELIYRERSADAELKAQLIALVG